jgi:hypothetical protein
MRKRTFSAFLVGCIVIFFLVYKTDFLYSKVNGILEIFGGRQQQASHAFDYFGNQLDVTKAFHNRNYDFEAGDINLSLKGSVVAHLEGIYNESISEGFIRDDKNTWKSARLSYGSSGDVRASIKIHGTSVSPWTSAPGLWDRVHSKFFAGDDGGFRLSTGGGAFNIKLKSKEKYLNGVRRLALLSSYDDWTITSNTLNRYAASKGLITSHGELKNLFINGKPIGLYLAYERINK